MWSANRRRRSLPPFREEKRLFLALPRLSEEIGQSSKLLPIEVKYDVPKADVVAFAPSSFDRPEFGFRKGDGVTNGVTT